MYPVEITFEQWEDEYQPVKNYLDTNASFSGLMFETYGDEFDFVSSIDPQFVWTLVDGDYGVYLVSGLSYVNRIGYFVTDLPWQDRIEITVESYSSICYECGIALDDFTDATICRACTLMLEKEDWEQLEFAI